MEYSGTLASAQEWAQNGKLEEWVHAYLLSDGHNKPFSDGLKIVDRIFLGPFAMPLNCFHRCTGPEEDMLYHIPAKHWESKVQGLQTAIQNHRDLPPLIAHYLIPEGQTEGIFELNDGNHRWEAFNRLGITEVQVIVWITDQYEYDQFRERFGHYLP